MNKAIKTCVVVILSLMIVVGVLVSSIYVVDATFVRHHSVVSRHPTNIIVATTHDHLW